MTFHLPFTGGTEKERERERAISICFICVCHLFASFVKINRFVSVLFNLTCTIFLHSRGDFHYYLTISLALLFFYQQNETHLHQFFILRGSKFEMDYICRPATTITVTSMDINQMVKCTHMCVCVFQVHGIQCSLVNITSKFSGFSIAATIRQKYFFSSFFF